MNDLHYSAIWLSICCVVSTAAAQVITASLFLPKPQGFYTMHYRRPHQDYENRCAQPAVTSLILSYQESYKTREIAKVLFGGTSWHVTGSQIERRNRTCDILADNFGLAPNFDGMLFFNPTIKNITFDLFYQLTLSSWCENLYLELAAPLVHSRWKLALCETIAQQGMAYFPACDMGSSATIQPAQSIIQAVSGNFFAGDLKVPWYTGRLVGKEHEITRLADISAALGTTLYRSEIFHLRAAVLTLMPTGNNYSPVTVFTPVVGNGGRWELGGIFEAHCCWNSAPDHSVDLYCTAVATHLFASLQRRIFDFTDYGPLSRYLLLKEFNIALSGGSFTYPYAGILTNAVNFATRACKVSCPLQGDITVQGSYRYAHMQLDLGYNLYGRTQEHICISRLDLPSSIQGHAFAPKGTEGTCYRLYQGDPITTELPSQPLSSAQAATIHGPGPIMNPQPILTAPNEIAVTWNSNDNNADIIGQTIVAVTSSPTYQAAQSSSPPRFLTAADLNSVSAAAPKSHVHTVFLQAGCRWDTPCIEPAALVGAAATFGTYGCFDALCEWSVWAQFNVRF